MFNKSLFIAPIAVVSLLAVSGCGGGNIISYDEAKNIVDKAYEKVTDETTQYNDDLNLKFSSTSLNYDDSYYDKFVSNVERTYSKTRLYLRFDHQEEFKTNKQNLEPYTITSSTFYYVLDNVFYTVVNDHSKGVTTKVFTKKQYNIETADKFTELLLTSLDGIKEMLQEMNLSVKGEFDNFDQFKKDELFAVSLRSEQEGELDSRLSGKSTDGDIVKTHLSDTNIWDFRLVTYSRRVTQTQKLEEDTKVKKEEFDFSMNYSDSFISYPDLKEFTEVDEL